MSHEHTQYIKWLLQVVPVADLETLARPLKSHMVSYTVQQRPSVQPFLDGNGTGLH